MGSTSGRSPVPLPRWGNNWKADRLQAWVMRKTDQAKCLLGVVELRIGEAVVLLDRSRRRNLILDRLDQERVDTQVRGQGEGDPWISFSLLRNLVLDALDDDPGKK